MSASCALDSRTGPLDLDAAGALLPLRLRQLHHEHPVSEARLDLVRVDGIGQPQRALEGAVGALDEVEVLLLAPDGQHVIVEADINVLLADTGQ